MVACSRAAQNQYAAALVSWWLYTHSLTHSHHEWRSAVHAWPGKKTTCKLAPREAVVPKKETTHKKQQQHMQRAVTPAKPTRNAKCYAEPVVAVHVSDYTQGERAFHVWCPKGLKLKRSKAYDDDEKHASEAEEARPTAC